MKDTLNKSKNRARIESFKRVFKNEEKKNLKELNKGNFFVEFLRIEKIHKIYNICY